MAEALNDSQVTEALRGLAGWQHRDDRLTKAFGFADFKEALAFINRVGDAAEAMSHHPELRNVYNRVEIGLCTHDAGDRVTVLDVELAGKIDAAASA